jgi:glycosyltransferase involved in cell wall biosynthesis
LAFALAGFVRKGNFNIVDTHNIQSHLWGRLSTLVGGQAAVVATVHSSIRREHPGRLKGILYETVDRLTMSRVDHFVAVSDNLRAELMEWGITGDRITVIPNGIRMGQPSDQERNAVRRELGLGLADQVIGTVGRLEPAKAQKHLLEALRILIQEWPRVKCVLVGTGRLEDELRTFVADYDLGNRVLFTGFRDDVSRLLQAFDIFVLSSTTEGLPFALLEACAYAKPVVTTRVGGMPEVISDGWSGRLVEPGDVAELADAIGDLLADETQARQLGQRAAADVASRYSVTSMIENTRQAYRVALAHWERHR